MSKKIKSKINDSQMINPSEINPEKVLDKPIVEEMKNSFLDYAMSVIVARALPDVYDGLKPSQRRILVAANDIGLGPNSAYKKSAQIVGNTQGTYHPHGDIVIYPTLVKMAQDFSSRYPLIEGQGNFGSIDGDTWAAMRYTEARISKYGAEILKDLDKGTVLHTPNYDSSTLEPIVLPGAVPILLTNGTDGIAVGMATRIPPHNLSEVVDAICRMIDLGNKSTVNFINNKLRKNKESKERIPQLLNSRPQDYLSQYINPETEKEEYTRIRQELDSGEVKLYNEFESPIETEELIKYIKGPDFPLGGIIYNKKDILEAYSTGRGRVIARAKVNIEESKSGRYQIVVTEIPYQVNKSILQQHIAQLVKDKVIDSISEIVDESNIEGMRIVIHLKKDAQPQVVLNKLYKRTDLQKSYSFNMISLVDGEPVNLNLKRILELYITHRIGVVTRRMEFELANNRYRQHILDGYLKALDQLDEVIKTIRTSKTQEDAKTNLMLNFDFTTAQADAILEMQLRRLAALEREKIQNEYTDITKLIEEINNNLDSDDKVLGIIKSELIDIKKRIGDARRTKVVSSSPDEIEELDVIENKDIFITLSRTGYIKRTDPSLYKVQNRGGKGIQSVKTKEDDYIHTALYSNTHDDILLFSNLGRVFTLKGFQIPEASRIAKGTPVINLINTKQGEVISSIICRPKEEGTFILMATKNGLVKKTKISEYKDIRSTGLIAIKLKDGDELIDVKLCKTDDNIILSTKLGKAIRFKEESVRSTNRNSMGVTGIRFKKNEDCVISMDVVENGKDNDKYLCVVSEKGIGKLTRLSKYSAQNRGGQGVITFKIDDKVGNLITALILDQETKDNGELMIITEKGITIKIKVSSIRLVDRNRKGVKLMNVGTDDIVTRALVSKE